MICGTGLDLLQRSGEFPCAICHTGVGSNSIFCNGCKCWVHKKCSGLKRLTKDPDYKCTWCQGTARPLDDRPQRDLTPGGGSFLLVPRRHVLRSWWLWTSNHNTCENRLEEVQGAATSSLFPPPLFQDVVAVGFCVRSAMLHASETWPLIKPNLQRLQRNDRAQIRQKWCHAARHCHHQIRWATCAAWGAGPHSEGEKATLVWTCGTLQWCSQDSLWPTGWWKVWAWEAKDDMEAADREGLQRVEALSYRPSWQTYLEIWWHWELPYVQ